MTVTAERAESTTPSAVIDRVSLVLDAFDGPGRLTLAQIVRRTGLPRSSAHRMLERLVAAALAAPQRPRLRTRHATGRARLAGGAPGPAAPRGEPPAARIAPRDRPCRAPRRARRYRRRVPGEDRRPDGRRDPHPGRRTPARALHRGRQGDPGVPRRGRVVDLSSARPSTRSARPRSWLANWPRCARTASRSTARSRWPDSVASQHRSAIAGEAVAAVSVCGPMSRMTFDQRLAAPVRMTAMGIWRNVDDGPRRVVPTLQAGRRLRGGAALQYA